MIHDCFLFCDGCSWVPCLFWTVKLSSVLQKNPPCSAESSVFQHLLHIWTLSSSDCMILRSIFSHWGQLRDSNTTIKKGSNIQWCSRRKHDALRAGGWKRLTWMKMSTFFLFCRNIYFFPFSTALPKQQKILACFPEDKLSTIYLDLQIQKVFTPRLLMHRISFWSITECFNLFNSCVWVPQLSSVWKDGSQNHTVTAVRVQIYKRCWKTEDSAEHGGFFWRTVLSLTVQNKQGTHEQPSQNKKQSWIIR